MKIKDYTDKLLAGAFPPNGWAKLFKCSGCGAQEIFIGNNPTDCHRDAKRSGWKPGWPTTNQSALCPPCRSEAEKDEVREQYSQFSNKD